MKFISAILICFVSINVYAKLDQDIVDYADFLRNQIIIEYKNRDKNFNSIERDNLPYVECLNDCANPNNEVSYFLHGYMGSPHEMKYLAVTSLNKGQVVFNDLIFGHGYDGKMANKVKKELFYAHAEKNLIFIFNHAKKVHLTGFSTGGLIISTFLNRHPEYLSKVGRINLVSPFYFSNISIAPAFAHFLDIFISNVPVDTFYKISNFPDVVAVLLEPKYYLQTIPVKSAIEIASQASQFVEEAKVQNDLNNINIYLTKKDEVLNFSKSLVFLQKIYPKAKITELDNGKFPHHLMVPSVSDEALIIKNNL